MKVLGLDLSTYVGWAYFYEDDLPLCGTFRLPKVWDPEDFGSRSWPLMKWLEEEMIAKREIDLIVFESPWIPMKPSKNDGVVGIDGKPLDRLKTTQIVLRMQITWAAVIETTAKKHGIECMECATNTAKKTMAGSARLENKKLDMVNAATARGFRVADDHQADACAVAMVEMMSRDVWPHDP